MNLIQISENNYSFCSFALGSAHERSTFELGLKRKLALINVLDSSEKLLEQRVNDFFELNWNEMPNGYLLRKNSWKFFRNGHGFIEAIHLCYTL